MCAADMLCTQQGLLKGCSTLGRMWSKSWCHFSNTLDGKISSLK
jgi:hypothetical protein